MNITLFFTYGTSLRTWERTGMLDRELAIYRKYIEMGHAVSLVTYGRKDRRRYDKQLGNIRICCNEFGLPHDLYARLIPRIHAGTLRHTDVVKSNQTPGALTALNAARRFGKPMVARSGYLHSEFLANQHGADAPESLAALDEEHRLFTKADHIIVTTPMMQSAILSKLPEVEKKLSIIPNYVDTALFAPSGSPKEIDLLFIGRLVPQKNLFTLLDALAGLGLRTACIGSGELEQDLKKKSNLLGLDIAWLGNVPNPEIARSLDQAKAFILPSLYEGHPKTLIEAMSAGLPVIGTNVPGIREVIHHEETGLLCEPTVEGIRSALRTLMADNQTKAKIGKQARAFVIEHFALDRIAASEEQILISLVQSGKPNTSSMHL